MTFEEKRAKQRISKTIPVSIEGGDKTFATETIDISPAGAYCRTEDPLPLMSKVAIKLVVSGHAKTKKKDKIINCKGTVVRTHPVIVDGKTKGYDVAVFFDDMDDEDRELLSEYIDHSTHNS